MQGDGNLVLYGPWTFSTVRMDWSNVYWNSGTNRASTRGAFAKNQADGNFVIYGQTGAAWWSGTNGKGRSTLVLQNDGNVVLYGSYGATWSTRTGRL